MNNLKNPFQRTTRRCIIGFALSVLFTVSANADDTILFIGKQADHPWGSHMYLHTCGVLAKSVEQSNRIKTFVSNGWPSDADRLKDIKAIVVYTNPGAEFLLDGPGKTQFEKMMKDGVGLVTIHWASTVYEKNFDRLGQRWMGYLGGTWVSNVGLSIDRSKLTQLDPSHPICRGWKEYELHDEFYLNPRLSSSAKPFLQVTTKGEKLVVAWTYERPDGGRSYGTTLGHYYRNFKMNAFRRTIVNAILWTAKQDIPLNGAHDQMSPKDLELPPKTGK
ncbi:MAG TPA: hypothetical protein EYQ50_04025 [Verrucomicrobiales bacterium]|nr:hypothetical protein [Verrucomicrobiales bacterium]HIL70808.1 hypothetical protein [Verrucomicrobiota bacterium]